MRSPVAQGFTFLLVLLAAVQASIAQRVDRIAAPVDDANVLRIPRSTHPAIANATDRGRVRADMPMRRMVLMLKPSAEQESSLAKLLDELHNPQAANYQKWLTPEEYASRFGPTDKDIQTVSGWLQSRGFGIEKVARGRQWIEFSGTAAQVEAAFRTEMHRYNVSGEEHIANASDIYIPSALQGVVEGVRSLHDFRGVPMHGPVLQVKRNPETGKLEVVDEGGTVPTPYYTTRFGAHLLAPGDWARIYNTQPLLDAGTTGEGLTIAVVGTDTNIQLSDVRTFRQIFGLPDNDPEIILVGEDPGITPLNPFESEADLDVEWSGAVAPKAKIKFVTAASTAASFGFELALARIIDERLAPITTLSIGSCELFLGTSGNSFINRLYQQAVAEGITIVVAAGDTGLAGCDPQVGFPQIASRMVNGTASTPYDIAVGGTMFNENGADGTFWEATNRPDHSSAVGYIPEEIWNESCDPTKDPNQCFNTGAYILSAGSGGASNCIDGQIVQNPFSINCSHGYAKPSWQIATGVPSDKARDLPDVSLTAGSSHDGYIVCSEGSCATAEIGGKTLITSASVIGGTSAGAPSLAGALALLEEKKKPFLGLINFNLYKLARSEALSGCNSSEQTDPAKPNTCVFYDVTAGNNNVPGVFGVRASTGFDLASGLGSINFVNLVAKWDSVPKLPSASTLTVSTTGPITHGQPVSIHIAVAPVSGSGVPTGLVSVLLEDGTAAPFVESLNRGEWTGMIRDLPAGSHQARVQYSGDSVFEGSTSSPVTVAISSEDAVLSVQAWTFSPSQHPIDDGRASYNGQVGFEVQVTGKSGVGNGRGKFTILYDNKQSQGPYQLNSEGNAFVFLGDINDAEGIPPGDHTFQVFYQGDASLKPSAANPIPISIYKGAAEITIKLLQQQIGWNGNWIYPELYAGEPYDIIAWVHEPDTGALVGRLPRGTLRFYECLDDQCAKTNPISGDLRLGQYGYIPGLEAQMATLRKSFSAGPHQIVATYSGDENYFPAGATTRGALYFSTTPKSPLVLQLTQASSGVMLGQSQKYTLTVKSASGGPVSVRGTALLSDGSSTTITDPVTTVSGVATFTLPQSTAGQHEYWAVLWTQGGDQLQLSSNGVTTVVSKGSTTTSVSPTSISLTQNERIDVTATVTGSIANLLVTQPGGEGAQVIFYDSVDGGPPQVLGGGPQVLTTGTASNTSVHTLSVVLSPGTHSISAKFMGNLDWLPSASTATPVVVQQDPRGTGHVARGKPIEDTAHMQTAPR